MIHNVILVQTDITKLKLGKHLATLALLAICAQKKTRSQFLALQGLSIHIVVQRYVMFARMALRLDKVHVLNHLF